MEVEKVKIKKVEAIFYLVSLLFMLISGIVILTKKVSDERMQLLGWALLGFFGYFLYGKLELIYKEKKKKKKKKSNIDKKYTGKLGKNFIVILLIAHLLCIGVGLFLLSTGLSNLAVVLLYFGISIGITTVVMTYGFFIFLWKNHFELNRIIKKIKKKRKKNDNRVKC